MENAEDFNIAMLMYNPLEYINRIYILYHRMYYIRIIKEMELMMLMILVQMVNNLNIKQ